jgi:antitoxin StbD
MERILSQYTASISELKKNPTALLREAGGAPVAILNHNRPAAYLVPVDIYEAMLEAVEDAELAEIVRARLDEGETPIDVDIDEL